MPTQQAALTAVTEESHERLWVMGSLLEIVVTGEQTGGAYAVAEDRSSPGFGPPARAFPRG